MGVFLPREHGLVSWVGVPLLAALALAPTPATALGCAAIIAGFFAFNALRRRAIRAAAPLLAAGAAAGLGGVATASSPRLLAGALGVGLGAAGVALWALPRLIRRPTALEVAAILGFAGLGAALAISGGGDAPRACTVALSLGAWQVAGLWWVRRALVQVLPRREPWREGAFVAAGAAVAALAASCRFGLLTAPAVLLLAPLRVALYRPPTRAADARRLGLDELAWSLLAMGVAVAASR